VARQDIRRHPLLLPRGILEVLERQLGERRGSARRERRIERLELAHKDAERPRVDDDVVLAQEQHVPLVAEAVEDRDEERAVDEIVRLIDLLADPVDHLGLGILRSAQIDDRQRDRRGLAHFSDRGSGGRGVRGPQDLVPPGDLGQAPLERADIEGPVDVGGHLRVVRPALGRDRLEEPHLLLARRERVHPRVEDLPAEELREPGALLFRRHAGEMVLQVGRHRDLRPQRGQGYAKPLAGRSSRSRALSPALEHLLEQQADLIIG
jgi:hypothetical protein